MINLKAIRQLAQHTEDNPMYLKGRFGCLRAWADQACDVMTREPTYAVEVIYHDQRSRRLKKDGQHGLRASTVANIYACLCVGEERMTTMLIERINQRFCNR